MKADLRPLRDAEIVRLFRQNVPQAEIGRRHGLNPPRVHDILIKAGVLTRSRAPDHAPRKLAGDGIWAADADKRRAAFHRRAAAAARAAREAMNGNA